MIIFVFLILLCALPGVKAAEPGTIFPDYISRARTTAINGVFVLLVFFSHVSTYIKMAGPLDAAYQTMKGYLGQLVVVTFLFFSGFGMMESITKKGMAYVRSIPWHRFCKVLLHMILAVLLFWAVDLALKKPPALKNVLLAFIGWTSIGNSNWYIFAVLALYVIVFLSFIVCKANRWVGAVLTTVLSVLFVYWQIRIGRDSWTYNTVIVFAAGMWYSLLRAPLEKLAGRNTPLWFLSFGVLFALYLVFDFKKGGGIEWYSLWAICFVLVLVMLSMKLAIGNRLLQFFGAHVFSIYILQRIPMLLLSHFGYQEGHPYRFVVACFAATLVLAVLFDYGTDKLDALLFRPRKPKQEKEIAA